MEKENNIKGVLQKELIKDKKGIERICLEWASDFLGSSFQFRQYQLDNIVSIIYNIVNEKSKIDIVEAPTGSGKSIIAIVVCGVCWKYYHRESYILASDINLLNQYVSDFAHYGLHWGHLKGMNNYECEENNCNFSCSMCKLYKIPYSVLMDSDAAASAGFPCASLCTPILDRKLAISSPCTLMTYQLYFWELNFVKGSIENKISSGDGNSNVSIPFDKRPVLIGDECHKLPDIIQSLCTPEMSSENNFPVFKFYIELAKRKELPFDRQITVEDFKHIQHDIFTAEKKEDIFNAFIKYHEYTKTIVSLKNELLDYIKEHKINLKQDKESYKAVNMGFIVDHLECSAEWYIKAISLSGLQDIVVNGKDEKEFSMNSVRDDFMVKAYFHDQCCHEVLMSATIGDTSIYKRSIGIEPGLVEKKDYTFSRIPSTFDFSKSPIFIMQGLRMSYKLKEQNFPRMIAVIDQICQYHKEDRGIIHTGSYDFASRLETGVSPETKRRFLSYHNSHDKTDIIDEYLFENKKILVGPSLIEGINLPDDKCRFMIVMKVPYASLADKLVQAKNDMIQGWYAADTIKKVIQSLGRGIRHKQDWCITYILDGCFIDLLRTTYGNLNPELLGRFKMIQ